MFFSSYLILTMDGGRLIFIISLIALVLGLGLLYSGYFESRPGKKKEKSPSPEEKFFEEVLRVDLSDQGLDLLPAELEKLSSLAELDVSGNNLVGPLPGQILRLKSLVKLKAGKNKLSLLPPEIGQLRNLEEVDLSENNLSFLPEEAGSLTKLKSISLAENLFEIFPGPLSVLPNLEVIDLSGNRLNKLPSDLTGMLNLKKLDLRGNKFNDEERERIRMNLPKTKVIFNL